MTLDGYEEYVGFVLNMPRAMQRQTWMYYQALCAAGADDLPLDLFRSVTETEDEAQSLWAYSNIQRQRQKLLAKIRAGQP